MRVNNLLKRQCNITILQADKGGATVVLGTEEYKEKAVQQLPYATTQHVLTSDPTTKQTRAIQKTLDRLMREEVLPQTTACAISPNETSIARANCLP